MTQGNSISRARKSDSRMLRVRRARAADLPALGRLYAELHLDDYRDLKPSPARLRKAFRALVRDRDHHILVAERDGEIVGTLHLLIFRHLGHGLRPAAIVENVVVSGAHRSQGIGETMLGEAARIARANRCYKLALTTNVARKRAHRFYERLGWRRTHYGYSLGLD
jgi:GNAT superfamily N-acetyltransferase